MQIYLSYRRDDTAPIAERIYELMHQHYQGDQVVRDLSVPSLADYLALVPSVIAQSQVVLVVIGPHWLDARDPIGYRLLDNPDDPAHIEIKTALQLKKLIIPLLVNGASMPPTRQLPPDLAEFALRQAYTVRPDPQFQTDMRGVYEQVNTQLAWRPASRWLLGGAAALGMWGAALFALQRLDPQAYIGHQQTFTGADGFTAFMLILGLLILTFGLFVGAYSLAISRRQGLWLLMLVAYSLSFLPLLFAKALPAWYLLFFVGISLFALFGKRREVL